MKTIQKFKWLLAAVACLTVVIFAEIGTVDLGIGTQLAASTTTTSTNLGNALAVNNTDNIGFQFRAKTLAVDESAGNITIKFARSVDGSLYETTPLLSWVIPSNSTNLVYGFTNYTPTFLGAAGWIKVVSIQNGATNTITNLTMTAIIKRIR